MQTEVSVKKPTRAGCSSVVAGLRRTSGSGPNSRFFGIVRLQAGLAELTVVMPVRSPSLVSAGSSVSTGARPPTGTAPDSHPGPPAVLLEELQQLRPARTASRPDVAGRRPCSPGCGCSGPGRRPAGRCPSRRSRCPAQPQWYGTPIWCTIRPPLAAAAGASARSPAPAPPPPPRAGHDRRPAAVAPARAPSASCGQTSTKNSGCSSARYGSVRLIAAGRVVLGQPVGGERRTGRRRCAAGCVRFHGARISSFVGFDWTP